MVERNKKIKNSWRVINDSMDELVNVINKYENILIYRHKKPDGDAFGSQFALGEIIKDNFVNKNIFFVGENLELEHNVFKNIFNEFYSEININSDDVLNIILDCPTFERIQGNEYLKNKNILKIDHHIQNEKFESFSLIDEKSSSTCEIISRFSRKNNLLISKKAATYLLTGIITDTGRFMYSSVSERTFEESFFLMKIGVKIHEIVENLNDKNLSILRLQGHILSSFEIENDVAYYLLPKNFEKFFNVKYELASSMVFLLMLSNEINYGVYVSWDNQKKMWKGSLRSKKKPINLIAEEFNGGGHKMAAGFQFKNESQFQEVIKKLKKLSIEN